MSKKKDEPVVFRRVGSVSSGSAPAAGCGFYLLNLSLLLAAPTALVALAVKGARR